MLPVLLCALVALAGAVDNRFIDPPQNDGQLSAPTPTWTIGQSVTVKWSVNYTNYDMFIWPSNDPTARVEYLVARASRPSLVGAPLLHTGHPSLIVAFYGRQSVHERQSTHLRRP